MDIYEKLIKRDYNKFLDDIEKAADKYAIIINTAEEKTEYSSELENLERIQGAPGYLLYCMGDNRGGSNDSRRMGPFKKSQIDAKVLARIYPFNKMKFF